MDAVGREMLGLEPAYVQEHAGNPPSCLGRQACKDTYTLSWNLKAE